MATAGNPRDNGSDRSRPAGAGWLEQVDPEGGVVPAAVFSDPDLYRWELDAIFGHSWLFVAHESEIPAPGDYVSRTMGADPVVVVRGEDGEIRVLLNQCRHRGMRVCRSSMGNTSHFRCPYHGFTYRNDGRLIGVPFQRDVYGTALDKAELGLVPARVERFHGLVFAAWDPALPSLAEYLGDMAWYLQLVVGRAEMEVMGPPHQWEMPANWKLAAENFMSDSYHTAFTHASIAELRLTPGKRWAQEGYHITAGNGHGLGLGTSDRGRVVLPEECMEEYRTRLSPVQWEVLRRATNVNGTVFPNFSFLLSSMAFKGEVVSHTTIRQWLPLAADRMAVMSWILVEKRAAPAWKQLSAQASVVSFSSSGMLEQDDAENWVDISQTARAPQAARQALVYRMGLERRPVADWPGPGRVYPSKYSEANARHFYRHWLDRMRRHPPGGDETK